MSSRCKERHAVSCQAIDLSMHFCRPKASDGSDSGSSLTKVAEEPNISSICKGTLEKKRDRSLSWGKHDRCTQIKGCVGEVLGPEYLLP